MAAADRVEHRGEAVVLVGERVVRLSTLATTVVDLCADWRDTAWLTERLAAEFGAPPSGLEPEAATDAVLGELVRQGLLESG